MPCTAVHSSVSALWPDKRRDLTCMHPGRCSNRRAVPTPILPRHRPTLRCRMNISQHTAISLSQDNTVDKSCSQPLISHQTCACAYQQLSTCLIVLADDHCVRAAPNPAQMHDVTWSDKNLNTADFGHGNLMICLCAVTAARRRPPFSHLLHNVLNTRTVLCDLRLSSFVCA